MPDDYTKSSYTDWFVSYEFKIYIDPCLITTYAAAPIPGPIYYTIGDPGITDGTYIFNESPVCNYPETVTISPTLPFWISHSLASSDFTIPQTADLSLIGEHTFTIRSEIQVPDDFTGDTTTMMFDEDTLVVRIEPCDILSFTTIPISKVVYIIGDPAVTSE